MKTLLIVMVLLLGGKVELYHAQFNSTQECEVHVDEAMVKYKDRPNYAGAIAVCTTTLQEVPKGYLTNNEPIIHS